MPNRADDGSRHGLVPCVLAALCSVLLPGSGHAAIRARWRAAVIAAAMLNLVGMAVALGIVAPLRSRSDLADVLANRTLFVGLALALVVLAATRLWSALDSAWLARPRRPATAAPSGAVPGGADSAAVAPGRASRIVAAVTVAALTAAGVAPLAVAADYVWQTDRAIEQVFSSNDATTAYPGPVATTIDSRRHVSNSSTPIVTIPTDLTGPTTVPPTTVAISISTTLPPIVGENRVNVLLLGGDAGPGRWSLRTDSMIVVSVDPATGDTVMISVPRNLTHLPFPPGSALADRFPNGFNDLANAVYPYVNRHRDLAGGGDDAGAQAVKLGIAQLLGMPINYYVLVDMAGFVDVVDALGGIDIDVATRLPSPGNPGDAKHDVPAYIEPGLQHMDGTLALAYARTRKADSDYRRMARQRCVLAAIATAATPMAVATGLTDLLDAVGNAVRTDIPRERLGELTQLFERFTAAGGLGTVRTLHLAPPKVSSTHWDAVDVRMLVAGAINPAVPAATPPPASPTADGTVLTPELEECHA